MKIEFVIDCGPRVGMGHLSRGLTLARALTECGAEIRFKLSDANSVSTNVEFPVEQLDRSQTPTSFCADLVVVDGLAFSSVEIARFGQLAPRLAIMDDLGDRPVRCDVLINQNVYGAELTYAGYEAKLRLVGAYYALVRPEFATARTGAMRSTPRVVVTFGGGATGSTAIAVAQELAAIFPGPIDVAVGAAAGEPFLPLPTNVRLLRDADMTELMARATIYVGSLGVTFLEALAAGLPVVAAAVADNQRLALSWARRNGIAASDIADPAAIASNALAHLHAKERRVFAQPDGRGAARLASALIDYVTPFSR